MKKSKYIIYTLLFCLSFSPFLSCSNDDDNPGIDPNQEIILATFDYSNLSVNSLPNMIIANDAEGKLLTSIETNKIPGIYTLTAKGYTSNSFMLTTLLETDSYKSLSTIKNVPVSSKGIAPDRNATQNGLLRLTLNLTGTIRVDSFFINGLRNISDSTNEVDPLTGAITRINNYNKENSADRLFLKIRYKPNATDPVIFAYKWLENYKEIDDITINIEDFIIAPSTPVIVDDEADSYYLNAIAIYENNHRVSLEGHSSELLNIPTGFDRYLINYNGEYPNINHIKAITSTTFPEIISVTKPDWDFKYTSSAKSLQLQVSGNYLCTNMYTNIVNEAGKDLEWHIVFPNTSEDTIALPILPESLSGFTTYFEDTSKFQNNDANLINLQNNFNYEDYVQDVLNRTYDIVEQNGETISIDFNP